MPEFDKMPLEEARVKTATGKRAQRLNEYLGYINQLNPGEAGRLQPADDETPTAVRRRLTSAAKAAGKSIASKRVGDEVIFWEQDQTGRRRRGRPRKSG